MGNAFEIMLLRCSLLALYLAVVAAPSAGTIQRITILTSDCENCGMTALGQVNLKICGGNSERCCSVVNIANFDSGLFVEGQVDNYSGERQLETCYNYRLDRLTVTDHFLTEEFSLTLYHEGTDGGQLDWLDIITDIATIRCTLGQWMDEHTIVRADNCSFVR